MRTCSSCNSVSRAAVLRSHVRQRSRKQALHFRKTRTHATQHPKDGKDGGEENAGQYENGFEKDAAVAVHNVLTAKAVRSPATVHSCLVLGSCEDAKLVSTL